MPYQKKVWNKPYKKGGRRAYSYGMGLKQLGRDVMKLKGLINTEFKFENTNTDITVTTTALLTLVNGLSRGTDDQDRDGAQVRWKSIQCSGCIKIHQSQTSSILRRIIFIDLQPNAAVPTAVDLLDLSAADPINAFRNLDQRKRFVILKDSKLVVSITGNQEAKFPDFYKKIDMKTIYEGNAGTIADINSNSIFILFVSNNATSAPTLTHSTRLRFIDN